MNSILNYYQYSIYDGETEIVKRVPKSNKIHTRLINQETGKYNVWESESHFSMGSASANLASLASANLASASLASASLPRKKNQFSDTASKILGPVNYSIVNCKNTSEKLNFKQYNQYISINIDGNKKFFDLFEIYKKGDGINVSKNKISFLQKFKNKIKKIFKL